MSLILIAELAWRVSFKPQHLGNTGLRQRRRAPSRRGRRRAAARAIARWKQVIGDGLRSRTDERRATEVAVAAHALNRMLELGRPNYVRVA